MWRAAKGLGCLVLALMAITAPAQAGTVEVAGGKIVFTAAPGETNDLDIETSYVEDRVPITAGPGCTQSGTRAASCSLPVTAEFVAYLGDGDDVAEADWVYRPLVLHGENGHDRLVGGFHDDRLLGGADEDYLSGGAVSWDQDSGDDELEGGAASDTLLGSGGDDTLRGDGGDDVLVGGTGSDTLRGGADRDEHSYVDDGNGAGEAAGPGSNDNNGVTADDGSSDDNWADDIGTDIEDLRGGNGSDTFYGTAGPNRFTGNGGEDTLIGRGGADVLDGSSGEDDLQGGEGDDELRGGWSHDKVAGGPGDDVLVPGPGADDIAGGADTDTLRYDDPFGRTGGITVRLGQPGAVHGGPDDTGSGGVRDTIAADIETLVGSGYGDVLVGTAGAQSLDGSGGDDILDGGPGADAIAGNSGDDVVTYADRADRVVVTPGTGGADDGNAIDGPAGARDTVAGDVEGAFGGAGADLLNGQDGDGLFAGGPGADEIRAGGGDDFFDAGAAADGNDILDGQGGTDVVGYDERTAGVLADLAAGTGGQAGETDTLLGLEQAFGGAGTDTLTGTAADEVLLGGDGPDTITGGAGTDYLDGEDGDDRMFARDGFYDDVYCSGGIDRADVDEDIDDYDDDCENPEEPGPPPSGTGPTPPVAIPQPRPRPVPFDGSGQQPLVTTLRVGVVGRLGMRKGVLRIQVRGNTVKPVRAVLQTTGKRPRTLATAAGSTNADGGVWLSLKLTRAAKRSVERSGRRGLRATLTVTLRDGGRQATFTSPLRLRRASAVLAR